MHHTSLQVIQDEHQALAAMLRSMCMLVEQSRRDVTPLPLPVLRAMLFYVDEFPERLHHPKESELLFPLVRQRCPELGPVLDKLEADHQHGQAAIRELEHLMLACEVMGDSRRALFEQALKQYVDGYLRHMAAEESEVLPAARAHLSAADWQGLDEAFAGNRDPLTGHVASDEYRPLFSKIVNMAPAPVGLG